jgi:hypothetical protein
MQASGDGSIHVIHDESKAARLRGNIYPLQDRRDIFSVTTPAIILTARWQRSSITKGGTGERKRLEFVVFLCWSLGVGKRT